MCSSPSHRPSSVPVDDGVDLDARDAARHVQAAPRPRAAQLAVAGERVVVGDRDDRDAAAAAAAHELGGVRTPSERSCACGGRPSDGLPTGCGVVAPRAARSPAAPASPAQTSTSRWMRSIASARPVAGSMSIWTALKTTGPLAHLEARRQRVDEARQDGRRVEADDAVDRPGHAEVRQVGGAARQDPLVAGDDVGVGARRRRSRGRRGRARARSSRDVSSQWKSTRRIGGSGSDGLVEQPVGIGERVLDRLHVRAALEVDDRDLGAVERVVDAPAAARDLVRAVVERPEDALVASRYG